MKISERINQLKGKSVKEVCAGIGEIKNSFENNRNIRMPLSHLQCCISGITEEATMLDTFKAAAFFFKNRKNLPAPSELNFGDFNLYRFERHILIEGEMFGERKLILFEKKIV